MLLYSAKKKATNTKLPYSVLKPDTNSDSASVRSKGTLADSAKMEIKNMIAIGNKGIINQILS